MGLGSCVGALRYILLATEQLTQCKLVYLLNEGVWILLDILLHFPNFGTHQHSSCCDFSTLSRKEFTERGRGGDLTKRQFNVRCEMTRFWTGLCASGQRSRGQGHVQAGCLSPVRESLSWNNSQPGFSKHYCF